jgi:hypothetical protein
MCDRGVTLLGKSALLGSGGVAALAVLLAACAEVPLELAVLPTFVPVPDCIPYVERIQHLDQPSDLGFSAVELLGRVAGETVSPLIWLPPEQSPEYLLAYGPESGRSQLHVRITPVEGEVRYRHEELSDNAPEGTVCAEGVLEVPVTVSLQSQSQALDETFPARLEAKSAYRAQLTHQFAPGSWRGGFGFTETISLDPARAVSTGPLSLSLVLWEGGSQGSLGTEVVSQPKVSGSSASAAIEAWPMALASSEPTSLALWPSAEPCAEPSHSSLPSDAKVLGFSVDDVLRTLASERARELTWSSGDNTQIELSFVPPASELCQGVEQALSFQTSVRVHTVDGRLDAELPVQINAADENGGIGEITVQSIETPDGAGALSLSGLGRGQTRGFGQIRVDLDASFRAGVSAGTITVSGVRLSKNSATGASATGAALGDAEGALTSELASARWDR